MPVFLILKIYSDLHIPTLPRRSSWADAAVFVWVEDAARLIHAACSGAAAAVAVPDFPRSAADVAAADVLHSRAAAVGAALRFCHRRSSYFCVPLPQAQSQRR